MKKERNNGEIVIKISIIWIFVIIIVLMSLIALFKNHVFAIQTEEITTERIATVEENEKAVDILELMIQNNNLDKKLINEERDIDFEIERIESDQIPKGEEQINQKGVVGKKQVTALQTIENGEMVAEEIIEKDIKQEPIKEIIYVGTSEFLAKYNVHIGEDVFLIETGDIKKEPSEDSENIYNIKRYLNVTLEEVSNEWAKIKYKDYEGYVPISKLTSESVTPKIKEKNRIAKLQANLNLDMNLNAKSELTLSDYKTIFANNSSDKNNIFKDNAATFYNMEQKYNINGIFLASIGIHESAWGTSYIAKEKNNLFGYKAYDRDPVNSAQGFENYQECIETVAQALSTNYLSSSGRFYNGATLCGVNTRYASDENWSTKVFKYMEYLYDKLG